MKHTGSKSIALIAASMVGCAGVSSPTPPLAGTRWQLVSIQSVDDAQGTVRPSEPARYTLEFGADGRVAVRLDCNRGSATWPRTAPARLCGPAMHLARIGGSSDALVRTRAALRRATAGLWPLFMAAMLAASAPAAAVPPPPARTEAPLELAPNGPELVFGDTVRAYQAVPVTFVAQAGGRLLLRLSDRERVLVLHVEAPSGLPWLSGAQPGPDGLVLSLTEAGVYRLLVVMSTDGARADRDASFDLRLQLPR